MTRLLREAAFAAVLTVAAPVWAQAPMTAEDLNRQELNRLAYVQQPARAAPPNGFDVLYSNAGIAKLGSVADTTEEVFDEILDANFRSAYFTVQKALLLLTDGGAIVFTTSWFDEAGVAGTSRCGAGQRCRL
jgi:NAD(P)-dependent dehydrogenase (short-subunit alcohol dehydrogenase family)